MNPSTYFLVKYLNVPEKPQCPDLLNERNRHVFVVTINGFSQLHARVRNLLKVTDRVLKFVERKKHIVG